MARSISAARHVKHWSVLRSQRLYWIGPDAPAEEASE